MPYLLTRMVRSKYCDEGLRTMESQALNPLINLTIIRAGIVFLAEKLGGPSTTIGYLLKWKIAISCEACRQHQLLVTIFLHFLLCLPHLPKGGVGKPRVSWKRLPGRLPNAVGRLHVSPEKVPAEFNEDRICR